MYCIICERKCQSINLGDGHVHPIDFYKDGFIPCYGPFTFSAPPEVPLQNVENLVVPDEEFMSISDANAESLRLEFV